MIVAALGGEGGGVLTTWLIEVAKRSGWHCQSTSLAGVAQRTGATVYYLEFVPRLSNQPEPVMSLFPAQGDIDIAVHSMKDMPVDQPDGLTLETYLPREDVRDAFISPRSDGLADLAEGTVVGTSSLRRRAQLLYKRPDLQVVEFRGNMQTRLKKLDDGVAEATFLAMAGLNRMKIPNVPVYPIEVDDMLPAVAQGAIGIERRTDDIRVTDMLAAIHDCFTGQRLTAERAFLSALDGSCETPIAGLAELDGLNLRFRGEVLRPDGSESISDDVTVSIEDGADAGMAMAKKLLAEAGEGFFNWRL